MLAGKQITISENAAMLLSIIRTVEVEKRKLNKVPNYCLYIEAREVWNGDMIDMHIAAIELQISGLIHMGRAISQQYFKTNIEDVEIIQDVQGRGASHED